MAKKPSKDKLISVNLHEEWLDTPSPFDSLDDDWNKIIRFYVFHVPVEGVSARAKTLKQFGWGNKSRSNDFKLLKARLTEVAQLNGKQINSIDKWEEVKQAFIDNNLEEFPSDYTTVRLTFRKDKSGICESLCNHIRNSFAHGRVAFYENAGEVYIAMEDIDKDRDVTARLILNKTILLRWIVVITEGPLIDKNDLYKKCELEVEI